MRRMVISITIGMASLASAYSGGSGTSEDPYQISTTQDLLYLAAEPNDYDKHFILVRDIDLDPNLPGGRVFNRAVIAAHAITFHQKNSLSIDVEKSFRGVFNGNGHIISNLVIEGQNAVGLFGCMSGEEAYVIKLGLEGTRVSGAKYVGGMVGYCSRGNILECYSTGSVSGNEYIGGLIGSNSAYDIVSCHSSGLVEGNRSVGGLVGITQYQTTIVSCYSNCKVMGKEHVGGLVGISNGSVHASFWDSERSTSTTHATGTGLVTAKMQQPGTYLNVRWDSVGEVSNGTSDVWLIPEGDYPSLAAFSVDPPFQLQGKGTALEPYMVADVNELGAIRSYPAAHFKLANDIDAAGITWGTAVVPWFSGNFDGRGYVIRNLQIKGAGYLGLFGHVASDASLTKLNLESIRVSGSGNYIGALAGVCRGKSISCSSSGSVGGDGKWSEYVGGLIGENRGLVMICSSQASVNGKVEVGGLVGKNRARIISSYSMGSVSGFMGIGGLVGANSWGSITSSYSVGHVSGDRRTGGLVATNDIYSRVSQCLWDTEASGTVESSGGVGFPTAVMKKADVYLDLGWDFQDEFANGTHDFWTIHKDHYPTLNEFTASVPPDLDGNGTIEEPYLLTDIYDLGTIWHHPNAHYQITRDIDLSGVIWNMAVVPWFNGHMDGKHHVISNLNIRGIGHLGFFGQLDSGASVSAIGLEAVDINATGQYAGGIAGYNQGRIVSCYSTGLVTGDRNVGGLSGVNIGTLSSSFSSSEIRGAIGVGGLTGTNSHTIVSCYSKGSVTAIESGSSVGGITGSDYSGRIASSYNASDVSGKTQVGGLVGYSFRSTIDYCYGVGAVHGQSRVGGLVGYKYRSVATSSFWDMDTTGLNESSLGDGLYTSAMHDIQTYLDSGWDFINESSNGTDDLWWMPHEDYPRLWWQN